MPTTVDARIAAGTTLSYRARGATGTGTLFGTLMKAKPTKIEVAEVEAPLLNKKDCQDAVPGVPKISFQFSVRVDDGDDAINEFYLTALKPPIPTYTWRLTNPNGSYWKFDGFAKSGDQSEREIESLLTFDFEVRCRSFPEYFPAPTNP